MKIKKLNIESYKHLQNISFDFTYPEGHKKAGKPLDKICLIGQSATGKTSILELIKNNVIQLNDITIIDGDIVLKHYSQINFYGQIKYLYNQDLLEIETKAITINGRKVQNLKGSIIDNLEKSGTESFKLLYLSTDLISQETINIFNQNPLNFLNDSTNKINDFKKKYNNENYIYQFVQDVNTEIWFSLLYEILDYRKRFNQWATELLGKGLIGDLNKLNNQISKWSETNVNPLINFAEKFNPILQKLNLEIDLLNTQYSIPIKQKNKDEVIPISDLSTGTKGLLLSMFPLYQLDTSDAIILIDEPERSLFPDMQIDLISHYQNLASNAQIIVATHSPFIAAAFEPEERFVLYFDKEGNVAVRKGESPIGDDPNDIIRNDFNVDYYNKFGKEAYQKYLDLKTKLVEETEPAKKKELVVELAELGDKYNF